MVHVMARITFEPGSADAGLGILAELAGASRAEPGCLSYEVFRQSGAPHVFQTVERWADQAAADAHMATPHVGRAIAAAAPLLAAELQLASFSRVA